MTPMASVVIEVCTVDRAAEAEWDEYVRDHDRGCQSHLIGWRRVIARAYGHEGIYLRARHHGRISGVLPLVLIRSRMFARTLVSMPFLDDGGICADELTSAGALLEAAVRLAADQNVDAVQLRHRANSGLPLVRDGEKVTCRLALADQPARLWDRLDGKVRNQVRKGMKAGFVPFWTGRDGLREFYDVFAENMRDLGSPVHSERFFGAILEEFPETARLLLVRRERDVVAAALCLTFGGTLQVPWASSLRQFRSMCPNNVLYWEAIRWGSEKGLHTLDFGRSSPGSGTHRFKQQWGATEEPLEWQLAGKHLPGRSLVAATDGRYAAAAEAWRRLPVWLTRAIGPTLRGRMSN